MKWYKRKQHINLKFCVSVKGNIPLIMPKYIWFSGRFYNKYKAKGYLTVNKVMEEFGIRKKGDI